MQVSALPTQEKQSLRAGSRPGASKSLPERSANSVVVRRILGGPHPASREFLTHLSVLLHWISRPGSDIIERWPSIGRLSWTLRSAWTLLSMQPLPFSFQLGVWIAKAVVLAAQVHGFLWLRHWLAYRRVRAAAWLSWASLAVAFFLTASSDLFRFAEGLFGVSRDPALLRSLGAVWVAGSFGAYALAIALRCLRWAGKRLAGPPPCSSAAAQPTGEAAGLQSRRQVMTALARAAVASPFAAAGYGAFIGRTQFEVRERDLVIPHLPPALEGFRIAQLTDIHMGPNLTAPELERVVAMANETRPHLALVTGDLITQVGDPLEKCLDLLAGLKADAGVRGCLGNHELFTGSQTFTQRYGRSLGIQFLRQQAEALRFGDATVNLCGVDYQRTKVPYLAGAGRLVEPDALNVLLSHNPDVFPVAAELGYDLVIGGHTHGGQVTVEIVEQWANAGRFFTPFVLGEYRLGRSVLYVSRGIGTVNLPIRIGALPEIALLRLRSA